MRWYNGFTAAAEVSVVGIPTEIQRVIDYIEGHLREDLTIVALADVAGYSPWHLYHLFAECTGTPLMEYVRLRRLRSAVGELAQGRKLYDIALDYGFETQAGFYKAFQRHFGCSPARYRDHKVKGVTREVEAILLDMAKGAENMNDRVVVRIVQEGDVDDLWENVFSRNTPNEVKSRVAASLQDYAAEKVIPLVAEVDGHAIGTMLLKFEDHPLRSHICTLYDVVVNPGFRRMGIARRLLEECKTRAAEKGRTLMIVSTRGGTTSETVYRKLGFAEYGRLPNGLIERPPFWDNECAYDEVFFCMPLTQQD